MGVLCCVHVRVGSVHAGRLCVDISTHNRGLEQSRRHMHTRALDRHMVRLYSFAVGSQEKEEWGEVVWVGRAGAVGRTGYPTLFSRSRMTWSWANTAVGRVRTATVTLRFSCNRGRHTTTCVGACGGGCQQQQQGSSSRAVGAAPFRSTSSRW